MIHFECDYACGAAPEILRALDITNSEDHSGYGQDEHCQNAAELLKEKCDRQDIAIHFVVGGTQANLTVIAAALRPFEGVLCAETGHINVHETGAVEATGHKVLALPAKDGKISAEQVREAVTDHQNNEAQEHEVRPGMVYVSHPTEQGTLYTREELQVLSDTCRAHGLKLFLDGARLVYGLDAMPDVDLPFLARVCDAFTLGGTKAGLLFGEAIVLTNSDLRDCFRYHIKQRGGMLAKGRLLGVQYEALLSGDAVARFGRHANVLARRLEEAFRAHGCDFMVNAGANQIFPIVPDAVLDKLREKYCFEVWAKGRDGKTPVRFCTSAVTDEAAVEELIGDLDLAF